MNQMIFMLFFDFVRVLFAQRTWTSC